MSVRGVPVQELLENQDPEVLFNLIEVTGEIEPLVVPASEEPAARKRGRPKKEDAGDDDAAAGTGE